MQVQQAFCPPSNRIFRRQERGVCYIKPQESYPVEVNYENDNAFSEYRNLRKGTKTHRFCGELLKDSVPTILKSKMLQLIAQMGQTTEIGFFIDNKGSKISIKIGNHFIMPQLKQVEVTNSRSEEQSLWQYMNIRTSLH